MVSFASRRWHRPLVVAALAVLLLVSALAAGLDERSRDTPAGTPQPVPDRLADGDPWAGIDDTHHSLEPLLDLWEEQVAAGLGELNYPPDHPKMPGEPPRVQPSKKVAEHWDADGNRVE